MPIKDFIIDIRDELANFIRPKKVATLSNFLSGSFNLWDAVQGKMQPTDFEKQIEANESWVYACVMAIAESCAMQNLKLYLKRGKKVEEVTEHIFLDVVQNVNPFMNAFELRELTEIYQLLTGNAYWYIVKSALGVPSEIWIVPSQYMKVVPDAKKFIRGYIYASPGNDPITFDADEIVQFKYPNPNNIFYGMGPLLAAAYAVDIDEYLNQYGVNSFKNMGLPAATLSTDQTLNEADAKRMREQWKQLYGGTTKAGKVAILQKGLKFEPITLTAQEMAYIQSKNVNRDTILGIFRVPKSVLGIVEDVNRANAEATEYIFNLRTVKPKLIRFEEKINEKIMPLYKQTGSNYLFVKFDDPVPKNVEIDSRLMQARLQSGYSSINEEREKNGDKPVGWGDTPILPFNMAPLGSTPAEEAPAETTPGPATTESAKLYTQKDRVRAIFKARFDKETAKIENIMKVFFEKQRRDVLSNLENTGKSFTKADIDEILFEADEWNDKLEEAIGPEFKKTYVAGAKHGARLADVTIDFNLLNPNALKWLADKTQKFSFQTNETTIKQLKEELKAGIEAGETTRQLSERVNKVFDFAETYRGRRIARTEVSDCDNKGTFDTWKEADVEGKEWLHGGGGETPRPEHQAINGQVRAIDDLFSIGLLYPGDQTNGDAGDVCNCTCSLLPVRKLEE